jgi:hypothetical protein
VSGTHTSSSPLQGSALTDTPPETTFLACLKVTTLFIFGFFDMIMTPAYIAAGEPLLKTAGGMSLPISIPSSQLG